MPRVGGMLFSWAIYMCEGDGAFWILSAVYQSGFVVPKSVFIVSVAQSSVVPFLPTLCGDEFLVRRTRILVWLDYHETSSAMVKFTSLPFVFFYSSPLLVV
uniref:Uncharacterized protein n=1 Tax=Opuntia streptacantha TaxID=393608 RepID=A0A7C8YQT9_OPUST